MKEMSGSIDMAKIILGACKVNLGSGDNKNREPGAEGGILKGVGSGGSPLAESHLRLTLCELHKYPAEQGKSKLVDLPCIYGSLKILPDCLHNSAPHT